MGYVFDPDTLQGAAAKGVGLPFDEMCRAIVGELTRVYPDHVDGDVGWLFNIASGATGIMKILHGSLSEYLIIFGSPIGTEAYSGRYHLEIHDWVISGEMWTYTEQRCGERVVTRPGEHAVLPRGHVKGYRIVEGTWMLEYGRGVVPTALPVGLANTLLICMDWQTTLRTVAAYGRLTVRELLRGKV